MSRASPASPFRLVLRLGLLIAALAGPLLAAAAPAGAQGTMGVLPGPMTTRELEGYAKRLSLSEQQRRAAEALHDQYKQEFRALREGEIAAFLRQMEQMEGDDIPQRKSVETFLKRMDELTRRIAAIDNRFFDQLQPLLTEQQMVMLPRARQARQRTRIMAQRMLWMGTEPPPDLSAIALEVELPAAEREAADAILAAYESRFTAELTKLSDESLKMIMGMFDALERMGFNDQNLRDEEQAEKFFEAMQTLWMDLSKKSSEIAGGMFDLNQRTYRSVAGALAPDAARSLRTNYYRRAFPETAFALTAGDRVFERVLGIKELTEEQRAGVIATRDDLRRNLDAVIEETVSQSLEWRRGMSPFEYDEDAANEYGRKQHERYERAQKALTAAGESLRTILGDLASKAGTLDLVAAMNEEDEDDMDMDGEIEGVGAAIAGPDGAALETPDDLEQHMEWGADVFLPPAIGPRDLAAYAERLGLDDTQRSVLSDLHQRYREQWQQTIDPQLEALQQATTGMWRWDEATQTAASPTAEMIENIYKQRVAALEAIRAVDASFFEEVHLALLGGDEGEESSKRMQRVRLARERATFGRGSWSYMSSGEANVDIGLLALRQKRAVPADRFAGIEAELVRWEETALPLFRERHRRALEAQKLQEQWSAEISAANMRDQARAMAVAERYQQIMVEPQRLMAEATAAISKLNRETVDRLIALLPAESGQSLRREYNTRAFPSVYGDPAALESRIERARRLSDLTSEQQRRLDDLAAEYLPAYAALSEQLVQATIGMERDEMMAMVDREDAASSWRTRVETLARLNFDRNELSARAAGKLRDALTEDQLKRIGGLPKVEDEDEFDW